METRKGKNKLGRKIGERKIKEIPFEGERKKRGSRGEEMGKEWIREDHATTETQEGKKRK